MYRRRVKGWTICSGTVVIREMSKSCFTSHGTPIRKELRGFFQVEDMKPKESRSAMLIFKNVPFQCHFDMPGKTARLFWRTDFEQEIKKLFPQHYELIATEERLPAEVPLARFERLQQNLTYQIDFLFPEEINSDSSVQENEDFELHMEGVKSLYWTTRYERDAKNRQRAIEIHGLSCKACGFNFGVFYGKRGENFIEIHHNKPLSSLSQETVIDPQTDLVPLCSNCHKMVHRRKQRILDVEELKAIIRKGLSEMGTPLAY